MNYSILALVVLAFVQPTALLAHETTSEEFQGYQIAACTTWVPNGGGFVCANVPSSVPVADFYSFKEKITQLETRLAELEKKLARLLPQ